MVAGSEGVFAAASNLSIFFEVKGGYNGCEEKGKARVENMRSLEATIGWLFKMQSFCMLFGELEKF